MLATPGTACSIVGRATVHGSLPLGGRRRRRTRRHDATRSPKARRGSCRGAPIERGRDAIDASSGGLTCMSPAMSAATITPSRPSIGDAGAARACGPCGCRSRSAVRGLRRSSCRAIASRRPAAPRELDRAVLRGRDGSRHRAARAVRVPLDGRLGRLAVAARVGHVMTALVRSIYFEVNANIANLGWPLLFASFWAFASRRESTVDTVLRVIVALTALTTPIVALLVPARGRGRRVRRRRRDAIVLAVERRRAGRASGRDAGRRSRCTDRAVVEPRPPGRVRSASRGIDRVRRALARRPVARARVLAGPRQQSCVVVVIVVVSRRDGSPRSTLVRRRSRSRRRWCCSRCPCCDARHDRRFGSQRLEFTGVGSRVRRRAVLVLFSGVVVLIDGSRRPLVGAAVAAQASAGRSSASGSRACGRPARPGVDSSPALASGAAPPTACRRRDHPDHAAGADWTVVVSCATFGRRVIRSMTGRPVVRTGPACPARQFTDGSGG